MTLLGGIWIYFTLIFTTLSIFHFIKSGKKISKFEFKGRPMSRSGSITALGADLDEPLKKFIEEFNSYIDNYNNSTSLQNKIAAFGYIAAAIIALVSLLLELSIIK
jgi:hypothetical protein